MKMNWEEWLLPRLIEVLEDEFPMEIGLVDIEGVSQRVSQARKLDQHSCRFCVWRFKIFWNPRKRFFSEKIFVRRFFLKFLKRFFLGAIFVAGARAWRRSWRCVSHLYVWGMAKWQNGKDGMPFSIRRHPKCPNFNLNLNLHNFFLD